jgi:zinc/manganese transport system permease protein
LAAAAGLGVAAPWLGILLAYDSYYWPPAGRGWPVGCFVVTRIVGGYLLTGLRPPRRRAAAEAPEPEQGGSPA